MLEKHPDTMTSEELYEKINSWVRTKTPESIFLDYKRELNFDTNKEKIELAKDVSSFANTKGGCLIYGIDEDRTHEDYAPIPNKLCRKEIINKALIDIENIIGTIITPPLPSLRIREINLSHDPEKVIYLIWHPESWFAPHMISGYKHGRYYKRGNFKAEPMQEYEIESKYRQRLATYTYTRDFIKTIDFGFNYKQASGCVLKLAVAPLYLIANIKYFSYEDTEKLLPSHRRGYAISFLDGVVFKSYSGYFTVKLFFNGALSICVDMSEYLSLETRGNASFKLLDPDAIGELFSKTIFPFISNFYKNLKIYSPVLLNLSIENAQGILLKTQQNGFRVADYKIYSNPQVNDFIYNDTNFEFSETFSASDLFMDARKIIASLIGRIKYGFGSFKYEC
jgi:hypothetical protein